ncbi:hypothetical protein HDU96_009429 [Phlyctochytrium bullatum]|nr:hypothetical protein HDU96_009429 [Phlyctochytrium bullatum]
MLTDAELLAYAIELSVVRGLLQGFRYKAGVESELVDWLCEMVEVVVCSERERVEIGLMVEEEPVVVVEAEEVVRDIAAAVVPPRESESVEPAVDVIVPSVPVMQAAEIVAEEAAASLPVAVTEVVDVAASEIRLGDVQNVVEQGVEGVEPLVPPMFPTDVVAEEPVVASVPVAVTDEEIVVADVEAFEIQIGKVDLVVEGVEPLVPPMLSADVVAEALAVESVPVAVTDEEIVSADVAASEVQVGDAEAVVEQGAEEPVPSVSSMPSTEIVAEELGAASLPVPVTEVEIVGVDVAASEIQVSDIQNVVELGAEGVEPLLPPILTVDVVAEEPGVAPLPVTVAEVKEIVSADVAALEIQLRDVQNVVEQETAELVSSVSSMPSLDIEAQEPAVPLTVTTDKGIVGADVVASEIENKAINGMMNDEAKVPETAALPEAVEFPVVDTEVPSTIEIAESKAEVPTLMDIKIQADEQVKCEDTVIAPVMKQPEIVEAVEKASEVTTVDTTIVNPEDLVNGAEKKHESCNVPLPALDPKLPPVAISTGTTVESSELGVAPAPSIAPTSLAIKADESRPSGKGGQQTKKKTTGRGRVMYTFDSRGRIATNTLESDSVHQAREPRNYNSRESVKPKDTNTSKATVARQAEGAVDGNPGGAAGPSRPKLVRPPRNQFMMAIQKATGGAAPSALVQPLATVTLAMIPPVAEHSIPQGPSATDRNEVTVDKEAAEPSAVLKSLESCDKPSSSELILPAVLLSAEAAASVGSNSEHQALDAVKVSSPTVAAGEILIEQNFDTSAIKGSEICCAVAAEENTQTSLERTLTKSSPIGSLITQSNMSNLERTLQELDLVPINLSTTIQPDRDLSGGKINIGTCPDDIVDAAEEIAAIQEGMLGEPIGSAGVKSVEDQSVSPNAAENLVVPEFKSIDDPVANVEDQDFDKLQVSVVDAHELKEYDTDVRNANLPEINEYQANLSPTEEYGSPSFGEAYSTASLEASISQQTSILSPTDNAEIALASLGNSAESDSIQESNDRPSTTDLDESCSRNKSEDMNEITPDGEPPQALITTIDMIAAFEDATDAPPGEEIPPKILQYSMLLSMLGDFEQVLAAADSAKKPTRYPPSEKKLDQADKWMLANLKNWLQKLEDRSTKICTSQEKSTQTECDVAPISPVADCRPASQATLVEGGEEEKVEPLKIRDGDQNYLSSDKNEPIMTIETSARAIPRISEPFRPENAVEFEVNFPH